MSDVLQARDANDVEAAVRWALGESKALEIIGLGSKRALGRPAQWDVTLDLSQLSGVTLYEPEELVLSAKAGTPIAEIEALVEANRQQLAFEPMDFGPLLGVARGAGTIGGVLAANISGPRRIKSGAARDHFLGVGAVSGRGEAFKSGGRVVKNVTGYDLCKLLAGSWGTLAVMTDVTVKTLPRADTEATLAVHGLSAAEAISAMSEAMASFCDVSGAAHLPARIARQIDAQFAAGDAATVLRLEGVEPSVKHRLETLSGLMKVSGSISVLDAARSRSAWSAVRNVTPLSASGPAGTYPVWRISTTPSKGAEIGQMIAAKLDAEFIYDWAGGLVWAVLAPTEDAGEAVVRAAVASRGGHATLVRAPASIRAVVPVFEPEEGAQSALTTRIKESFDPQGVLNRGRMWAGV